MDGNNTPRDTMIAEISRAEGVIMTLYALVRDCQIGAMVDEAANGKMGDVIGDTLEGLNRVIHLWDGDDVGSEG